MRPTAWHDDGLTGPERRVVRELARDGASNVELGQRLFLSPHTVKEYLSSAMAVSGTCTRTGLALWWIRVGQWRAPSAAVQSVTTSRR